MDSQKFRQLQYLKEKIKFYDYMYFVRNTSIISDESYDTLRKELYKLEESQDNYYDPFSPSNYVGYLPETSNKNNLLIKMKSLKKANTFQEIELFFLKHKNLGIFAEIKIDGVSVSLEYNNGIFIGASTRGDGDIGQNISNYIPYINDIPLSLSLSPSHQIITDHIVITGEVFLKEENTKEFLLKNKIIKNSVNSKRNMAAGILSQKNFSNGSFLSFFPYSFDRIFNKNITDNNICDIKKNQSNEYNENLNNNYKSFCETQSQNIQTLKQLGFQTCDTFLEIQKTEDISLFFNEAKKLKQNSSWDMDGIVLKVNDKNQCQILGGTKRYTLSAIAFKFDNPSDLTKILNIIWQVGRSGILTPVAEIQPITISGSVINRVSLHNIQQIIKKKIGINSLVVIEKAGDIIPYIKEVCSLGDDILFPTYCPKCNDFLQSQNEELFCINEKCIGRIIEKLLYFCKKIKIENLGPATMEYLIKSFDFFHCGDLFKIIKIPEAPKEGIGEKNWNKISTSIKKAIQNKKFILCSLPYYNISSKFIDMIVDELEDCYKNNNCFSEIVRKKENIPEKTKINLINNLISMKEEIIVVLKFLENYEKP
jgi:DNA ligase (NAD+)